MNQAILEPVRWIAPWGRLMHQLHRITRSASRKVAAMSASQPHRVPPRSSAILPRAAAPARPAQAHAHAHAARHHARSPLRVIRVVEVGQASALAGRILMSGRMADVCAELDRMVEREAIMQSNA
ncbi:MAG: hypothetical protein ABIR55_22020 [Burkholderiaceae bacterium]